MKKERMKNKQDIQIKIDQINNEISEISPGESVQLLNCLKD